MCGRGSPRPTLRTDHSPVSPAKPPTHRVPGPVGGAIPHVGDHAGCPNRIRVLPDAGPHFGRSDRSDRSVRRGWPPSLPCRCPRVELRAQSLHGLRGAGRQPLRLQPRGDVRGGLAAVPPHLRGMSDAPDRRVLDRRIRGQRRDRFHVPVGVQRVVVHPEHAAHTAGWCHGHGGGSARAWNRTAASPASSRPYQVAAVGGPYCCQGASRGVVNEADARITGPDRHGCRAGRP